MSDKKQNQEFADSLTAKIVADKAIKFEVDGDKLRGVVDEDLFKSLCPEDVDLANYARAEQYATNFAAANVTALTDLSIPEFKKHKDLESVELTIPTVNNNSISISITKQGTYRDIKTKEERPTYGSSVVKYVTGTVADVGLMAAARQHAKDKFREEFGG